jgi:pimeloyl-ACP methyl ester carboxylesterase
VTPALSRRRLATAVVLLATAGLAAGALLGVAREPGGGARRATGDRARPVTTTSVPPAPATTLPVVPVSWSACADGLQCGSVTAPLDYADPTGPAIQIALARHPAEVPAARLGSLVINPGGPGGSGIDDLPAEVSVMTPGLLDDFDVVSFDPRGVDRSSPVACGETGGPAAQGPLPDPVPSTAAARQQVLAEDGAYARQCEQASGSELPYVGTVDAARDLDRIRVALGDTRLTYIGHSYGTLLGLVYAEMFPTHVRAMVLDGVIDPALSTEQMVTDQAVGFEAILGDFFAWCRTSRSCAWQEGADPAQALLSLASSLRGAPLPAGSGRTAGPGELYTAVLSALYNTSAWSTLGSALARAETGDGGGLVAMTTSYNTENGPNAVDADNAISCLDHPVPRDAAAYPQMAATAGARAPFFGPMLVWGLLQCAVWPVPPSRTPAPARALGAPPILLVSSSGDPATPHGWAQSVRAELAQAVLVTWEGNSHVAYYYSPCVRSIDQAYLLNGTLPTDGTVCAD